MLKIKKFKPMFTSILVTGNKYTEDMYDDHGLIENKMGDLKTYQTVLEVGPSVRDIKAGDQVMINVMHYAVMQYDPNSVKNDMDMNKVIRWDLPWVTVDDENGKPQECLLLSSRDIMYVFEGEEKEEVLVMPKEKKFLIN